MGELGLKRTTRFAAALGAGAGLILLNGIGFASENLQNLCWAALASSIALAGLTWAMAAGISAPLPELLQIRTPRRPLSAGGIALAVAGMLALSHASSLALARAGLLEGGALARFDGLERLIVIAVGLDAPLDEKAEDMLETRSRLYRALTRAHMRVATRHVPRLASPRLCPCL